MSSKPLSRRNFLQYAGFTGTALLLGLSRSAANAETVEVAAGMLPGPAQFTPYIRIDSSGAITIFNTRPEMGQGTFQSIPALICEELEVSLDQVTIKQSNGEKELGTQQRAGGSASIRTGYTELRKVGASAREMLIKAASIKWGVDVDSCKAEAGKVIHIPTNKVFTYGELAQDASLLEIPKEPKLKDKRDFKILTKDIRRPDVPLKTNGTAEFGIDVDIPDMVYATIVRCPVLGGTLKSFDATETLKTPGVEKVLKVERTVGKYQYVGVAVVATSYWAAMQGRKALKTEWDTKGYETFSSADYEEHLRSMASQEGLLDKNIGSVETVNLPADRMIDAFYETPMVAHHTMEPVNCVAHVQGDKLEIWTSTQVPSTVTGSGAGDLHKHTGFALENIKLHAKFIGGGLGRRLYIDYIIETVNLAKQLAKPVKVIWSREDTTEMGPFRPMTFSQLRGGISLEGKLVTFQHKVISPSYFDSLQSDWDKTKVDKIMVEGIAEQAYEIPNLKTSYVRADCHIPIAAWRSVTSSTLSFPHECFVDELAFKARMDPLAFRLSMLTKDSDAKRVLLKLKEISNWDNPLPKGKARGIAQWEFFAGLCAQVVEVSMQPDGSIKVDKVLAVIDLGEVVSPDNVKNQVEGAIVMALGAATKPGITFSNGKVQQSNFHDNPVLRINEMPSIEVHILAEGGKVKGVGEPGLPPFAPALGNAIFALTGKRLRKMPMDLTKI